MNPFISRLKDISPINLNETSVSESDFNFMITCEKGIYTLHTVDRSLKKVLPDYRYYSGDTAALLRSIARLENENIFKVSWDATDSSGLSLETYPHLLDLLTHCTNIVNKSGEKITVSPYKAQLSLNLRDVDEGTVSPCIEARCEEMSLKSIRFLSDSFILSGRTIYPINHVGDNYAQLSFFLAPFEKSMLDLFLSIFSSAFNNIDIVYRDYNIVMSKEFLTAVPTIIFEKVESDNAVRFRIEQTIDGVSEDFTRQFSISRIASTSSNNTIVIKNVRHSDLRPLIDNLEKFIRTFASGRKEAREVFRYDNIFLIPSEIAGPFLLQGLPTLLNTYNIIGLDKLKKYKVVPVQPQLHVSLTSGIDFLEGSADVEINSEKFTLVDLLAQYKAHRYVELKDGRRAVIDDKYMRRLERIFKITKNGRNKVRVSVFDIPEIESLLEKASDAPVFASHRKFYEGFNSLKSQRLSIPGLKATLRPYQTEGVKWIQYLYNNNMGGCLADDMGLGKTIQTIGMLSLIYPAEKSPTLIVMPRSLLFNWQNELKKFNPHLTSYTYYGNNRSLEDAVKHQIILTTYSIVRNDIQSLSKEQFHYIILDESQNIKNITAQTTRAVFMLKSDHRLALSGTPIENNLTELYSLFHFLNPSMLGSIDDFNIRYAYPIQRDNDKDATDSLRRKIFPFMLRRLKKDVLQDLPDRIEQTLYVEMDPEQASFYEQRRRYYKDRVGQTLASEGLQRSQFIMFQALSELRRIASVPESLSDGKISSPKIELLVEHIVESIANGHKAVVFFNFIAGIELVGEHFDREGIDYASMTGSTRDRRSIVERFQNDNNCKVLLMTLKTGGVGLNLTAADTVFIFEPWWNKAAEEQAVNRLHRIGQKSKVMSYSIISHDTIEEKIMQLQQQKSQLFDSLIESDSSAYKQLTAEDINFILS